MNNQYLALRHGEAEHNVQGIIASQRPECDTAYPLTEKGREQVRQSIRQAIDTGVLRSSAPLAVVASPLLRAQQTAEETVSIIEQSGMRLEPSDILTRDAWAERDFGNLNGMSSSYYFGVWRIDRYFPDEARHNGESANAVQQRVCADIAELEELFREKQIILCSHGDTLQIAQAVFTGKHAALHRNMPLLHTAELRPLN